MLKCNFDANFESFTDTADNMIRKSEIKFSQQHYVYAVLLDFIYWFHGFYMAFPFFIGFAISFWNFFILYGTKCFTFLLLSYKQDPKKEIPYYLPESVTKVCLIKDDFFLIIETEKLSSITEYIFILKLPLILLLMSTVKPNGLLENHSYNLDYKSLTWMSDLQK